MSDFVADVLGGYLTPLRMFNDFIDQDQELNDEVQIKDTTNKLYRQYLLVWVEFPEVESPIKKQLHPAYSK